MDATANTKLYYKDINSLYPHVSMTSPYVTGKPLVVMVAKSEISRGAGTSSSTLTLKAT